jgi:hypothetical protein
MRYALIPCVCDALKLSRRPTADRRSFLLNLRSVMSPHGVTLGSPAPRAHWVVISMHRTVIRPASLVVRYHPDDGHTMPVNLSVFTPHSSEQYPD